MLIFLSLPEPCVSGEPPGQEALFSALTVIL